MDLNSDLGESFGVWRMGDDASMLDVVTSANVACGFHGGDPAGIFETVRAAAQRGVAVGAHVGYRDLAGFGRRAMDVDSRDLVADVIYQIGALQGIARAAGTEVRYVKPHGALYNTMAHDRRQADDVVTAILAVAPDLALMALCGAPVVDWARQRGVRVITEVFADRAYTAAGALVPRREPGAVLHDPDAVATRALALAQTGQVESIEGKPIRLPGESICVHGDNPQAVAIARAVRQRLQAAGVALRSCV